ncbi:S-layer glycoprotein N-glycosyltransferase AglJ [Methanococcoides burtonii]|uniref:Glycosyl transferase, family 2 n=1 Tax=Methanococcoides burtonii (strain DSM 6242 / NBRC 107633 / OCM 468 / ACE-M) TaxID=259564 RepID=Q12VX4_METBU|nr:S-layer glycoprotein N-glycosyltransferase AglJ [Methanococcoides burtonii]ABE52402.1 glycosyl transferase, family 2 [Methanococcoides burtonii DSM 6242]
MDIQASLNKNDVCILIPTLNEEVTIVQLIKDFRSEGFENILVIDGHSSDNTRKLAEENGAKVIVQEGKGKGQAVQEAFQLIEDPYIVMIDGDGTYLASDVHAVLQPILDGHAEHTLGNRMANFEAGAFTKLNLAGNKILNKLFGFAYGIWLEDILTGYRGFTHHVIKNLSLTEMGFEIETEMTVESVKNEMKVKVVPITYVARHSSAATKLNPLRDGLKIAKTIFRMARLHNPMFYFGILGTGLTLSGIAVGLYVVNEWMNGVTRIPMTILTALLILTGIQMFIFGMLSDLIVSLHRETMRMLRKRDD